MRHCQAVVIGGGCGGLAAAAKLKQEGLEDVVLIERDVELGGVLNQCIHNGFGLTTFKEQLSGPAFAERYEIEAIASSVEIKLGAMVTHMSKDRVIEYVSQEEGYQKLQSDIIILAVGCYERSRGALGIPGERPTGVYTAGQAQRYLNIDGYMVGKKVFILGSGDIGLIMARRMSLEGAEVLGVAELMPYSNGLPRNMKQCLDDFGIPLYLSHTVTNIYGRDRLERIELTKVDDNRRPIKGSEMYFDVDTLLLSVGLIPENTLAEEAGIEMDQSIRGPVVDENYMTSVPGIFACGNGLHVHDLADFVTKQAGEAAVGAIRYYEALKEQLMESQNRNQDTVDGATSEYVDVSLAGDSYCEAHAGNLVGYVVPAKLHKENLPKAVTFYFRVRKPMSDIEIEILKGDKLLRTIHKDAVIPSEMEQVVIAGKHLEEADGNLTIQIKEN
ncbi:NAD(P)/FAD-dependent oxidoreductase [Mogibacterium pumilum]|uniref:Pyridine nucleotide-disulfide oxidoreductase n=1 Tax=Mogibacterium pumilum TaxID=86332 RepID=A0A223AQY2_9FIRM|nr:FAD-dependent oxidoreductase [Mogibacterium pumilum]ASS37356.1 pyridine nucleotide-disulfide oxidoreductase [Mogibacterium pumilum]